MPVTAVKSAWSGGKLDFTDNSGTAFLELDGANKAVDIPSGGTLKLAGTAITSSAAELNALAGGGVTAADAVKLHAIASTAAQIDAAANGGVSGNALHTTASPAGAGANQGNATALVADVNYVTGADGTVGVILPTGIAGKRVTVINSVTTALLKLYPATGAAIDAIAANSPISLLPGETMDFIATSTTQWRTPGFLRTASGVHTQAAASDTVVTGLRQVIAVVASFSSNPTVKQDLVAATIGTQAGAPAAGSILIKTFKPTSNVNDSTPTAATDFTDNLGIGWIAVGF